MVTVNMKKSILIISAFVFAFVSCSPRDWEKLLSERKQNADGKHWALVVAGSNGWYNYRHQADACHAYQILHQNGIPDERIVVMMFDDIANNRENPTPGVMINRPNGTDVYHGVPKDYTGKDVTPENFLSVLTGNASAVQGIGSGKVIASGPNDHVFVYFTDHGAPHLIAFPASELHSKDLLTALNQMHTNNQFKQLVFYLEACESGSMFKQLRDNINVFATTAANGKESSYACYFDKKRKTYLGDVYSVKWMEDSDVENLKTETLERQFEIVRKEVNTSHCEQFGDMSIAKEPVSFFQGGMNMVERKARAPLPPVELDAVPQEDVPIAILTRSYFLAETKEEKERIRIKLHKELELRHRIDRQVKVIAQRLGRPEALEEKRDLSTGNHECYKQAVTTFSKQCHVLGQVDYALRHMYTLVNLCEYGIDADVIAETVRRVCYLR
ncbi:legumain-like [Lineus longissimus]|uniref:legumain-like n=1 Tax=Lineus longissimus TaxID=88925 RepID=UPI00315DF43D